MYQRVFRGCLLAVATSAGVVLLGACSSDPSNAERDTGQTNVDVDGNEDASPNVGEPDASGELGVAQAAGQSVPNVLIAAYSTMPGTDAASRNASMTGAEWLCLDNAAYASCLVSAKAPTIPAKGSIWV